MIGDQIRICGTVFAALLGLAFGSFLNVCLSRWPEGESIVTPRSHCRKCGRTLAWWENVPLASWVALRGRCRGCGAWIGWRYVIVEAAVGGLWAWETWHALPWLLESNLPRVVSLLHVTEAIGQCFIFWFLIALAVLDAENLWLPDRLTLPGCALGVVYAFITTWLVYRSPNADAVGLSPLRTAGAALLDGILAAALILLIRWVYWLVRRREGLGLGDAKLMALLAIWLRLDKAILALGIGVVLGALLSLIALVIPRHPLQQERWAQLKMPLGTFLCIGGILSALWGQQIIAAYLRWAGF